MHVNEKEEISHQLQKISVFLNTAFEQYQNFKNSMKHTRKLMIATNTMNLCANRSLSAISATADTVTTLPSSAP